MNKSCVKPNSWLRHNVHPKWRHDVQKRHLVLISIKLPRLVPENYVPPVSNQLLTISWLLTSQQKQPDEALSTVFDGAVRGAVLTFALLMVGDHHSVKRRFGIWFKPDLCAFVNFLYFIDSSNPLAFSLKNKKKPYLFYFNSTPAQCFGSVMTVWHVYWTLSGYLLTLLLLDIEHSAPV